MSPTTHLPNAADSPAGKPASGHKAGRNLPVAITTGVLLFVAVAATLWWFHWGFILLYAAFVALGSIEVSRALSRLGMHAATGPIVGGAVLMVIASYLASQLNASRVPANTVLLASLGLIVLIALVWRMRLGMENYVQDAAASLFVIGYVPLLGSFAALMLGGSHGAARIICFIMCVMASDIGAFATGVLFGRHPMAPRISPKKTWEGFAGGIAFGMLVGAGCAAWILHMPIWMGLVFGAAMVCFGTCGDLIESLVKRCAGLKDMSNFLPGHGGVMDRLDSLLAAVPVAWLLLYLMVPGG